MGAVFQRFILLFILSISSISLFAGKGDDFKYSVEQFADIQILRYKIPGFEDLTLDQKKLGYYLYEAGLSGRDIIYDQNYRHNLAVRRTFEAIITNYKGERTGEQWDKFMEYGKRVWFANGIHHHYGSTKFKPEFTYEYFVKLVLAIDSKMLPLEENESVQSFLRKMQPVIFYPSFDAKKVNLDPNGDLLLNSAANFYDPDVSQKEAEAFYAAMKDPNTKEPISYGLNSKLVRRNGVLEEKVWKVGGMYTAAIEKIVFWLEKAITVAENPQQKLTLEKLVAYYKSGNLADFDAYNIEWVKDTASRLDVVNGFIEVYADAMGYRGTFESVVSFKDMEATKRIGAISNEAQWFEDNSPIMDSHKKKNVKGISAKVITVIGEAGDASPSTPIGINLPNANWIRATHGSKSVNLGNIVGAYALAGKEGKSSLSEFAYDEEYIRLAKAHGKLAGDLHTDMHEVIGHASGQINDGIGTPKETLKAYSSALEEGRADLVALYFLMDKKLVDMGVMPTLDVGKAEYNSYIMNGMMLQLKRLDEGEQIEEAHMRNRQMIAQWAFEKGKADNVIEKVVRDGKTYFVVNDYMKLRDLFGQLLREIQRIKSEGDFEAGKALIENYGVKVDPVLHKEVLARYAKLNSAAYSGFINPVLEPVMKGDKIVDIKVSYPDDFSKQMLDYSKRYSFLPTYN